MSKWKRYIPEGMRDILFEECFGKTAVENTLRETYLAAGFTDVVSPTLEFYDVFSGENQTLEQEKMYKLFDRQGRIVVLRPDMTTPIARIAATKIRDEIYPLKLCYNSNVFRINEDWNGKVSEITQSGIEIIGIEGYKADTEVIITAINALLAAGLKNFKIELGQSEFFKGILEDSRIDEEKQESLRKLIENKNLNSLKSFLEHNKGMFNEDTAEILNRLPQMFGDIKILEEARKMTKNTRALKALDNIQDIYDILNKVGVSSYIDIDLGMVHHINYYTGIIFRGYSSEVGNVILSGGRYDNLLSQFGTSLPATGLALNVDSIMISLEKQGALKSRNKIEYIVHQNDNYITEGHEICRYIREKSGTAEMSLLDREEETAAYALKKGIGKIIHITDNETVSISSLSDDTRRFMKISDFLSELE